MTVRAYSWQFLLDDGTSIIAKFTDEEIEDMKIKYKDVKWYG